ncbi:DoxX family protein [Paenibacillus tyrfis]|uniref:Oxidoreductase n=1 Tax=Paenibacillus tyrfis TaxID=1501230 RepID=A0A081NZP3_9BACL|nr:DoxX family protein [Paenibacillus tyrfis]KEQ23916.1 oxidoreductase [Paenibacillus tyrfis]
MTTFSELGALIVRIVLGVTFLLHGLQKFQSGIDKAAGFFQSVGLPGFLAYAVGGIELIGGICMILGLGVRVFGALFSIIMLGAILTVKMSQGFIGGYEFDLALFAMSLHLLISGNRVLAVDSLFRKRSAEGASA